MEVTIRGKKEEEKNREGERENLKFFLFVLLVPNNNRLTIEKSNLEKLSYMTH